MQMIRHFTFHKKNFQSLYNTVKILLQKVTKWLYTKNLTVNTGTNRKVIHINESLTGK